MRRRSKEVLVKAPVSIVSVEPGTMVARTAEASELTPGAAA